MELSGYLTIINRRRWVILLAVITALAVYFIGRAISPSSFSTEAVLRIVPYSSGDTPVTQTAYVTRILNNYVEIATSSPFLNTMRNQLGLSSSRPADVDVEAIPDSELLMITVKDTDPLIARDAANTIAEMLIAENPIRDIQITVIDPAVLPSTPSLFTTLINYYLVMMVGAVAGVGAAFLMENLDERVYDLKEIVKIVDLPIIGQIPFVKRVSKDKLMVEDFVYAESFRRLRINFLKIAGKRNLKTIMLTSAQPKEGKSLIAANLAIAMADHGQRILLIDADIRRPTIHRLFQEENNRGLIDVARGDASLSDVVVQSDYPGLDLIFCGTEATEEDGYVEMEKVAETVERLKQEYDHIFVDTPAYLVVADSVELIDALDGVILVAMQGQVRDYALKNTYQQLKKIAPNLIGLVINNDTSPIPADYHAYYRQPYLKRVGSGGRKQTGPNQGIEGVGPEYASSTDEKKHSPSPELLTDQSGSTFPDDGRQGGSVKDRERTPIEISKVSVQYSRIKRSEKKAHRDMDPGLSSDSRDLASYPEMESKEEDSSFSAERRGFIRASGAEKINGIGLESRPPRIVFISGSRAFPEDERVSSYFDVLRESGYQITVISPYRRGVARVEVDENVSIYRYPVPDPNKGHIRYLFNLIFAPIISSMFMLWSWRRKGLDVLCLFSPPYSLIVNAILPRISGKQVLLDISAPNPERYITKFHRSEGIVLKGIYLLEKIAARIATHITISRDSYLQLIRDRVHLPSEKFSVIRLGQYIEALRYVGRDSNYPTPQEPSTTSLRPGIYPVQEDIFSQTLDLLKNSYTPQGWS